MRQGKSTRHKVLFRLGRAPLFVQNLQNARLELCHIGDVTGRDTVFTITGEEGKIKEFSHNQKGHAQAVA